MYGDSIVFNIFLIFTGAAVLSTIAMYTRQSLMVSYIFLGIILGPWGLELIHDSHVVPQVGEVGITFLLFLLGLHLQPRNLFTMLSKVTWVAVVSSIIFAFTGYVVSIFFGFSHIDSVMVGVATLFSSTIIGLKLLPNSLLNHQHIGEVMISVLLLQDIIAVIVLLGVQGLADGFNSMEIMKIGFGFPVLIGLAILLERFVLIKLISRFGQIKEYIFLLSVGWCLGFAQIGHVVINSEEIGALIAGIALAEHKVASYIADSLQPLRDFFLVLFFFSIGAGFDFSYLNIVLVPAIVLSILILIIKPLSYYVLFRKSGEVNKVAKEVGIRLGQSSEFSVLLAGLAVKSSIISASANYLVQATTILTFIFSCYLVVWLYPTPLATSENMRQD